MRSTIAAGGALLLILGVVVAPADGAGAQAGGDPLAGTLELTAGACAGDAATGSHFRMILPSGDTGGPFVSNGDSPCDDSSYTLLRPGTDGGLALGRYQPQPSPAFDDSGNSLAERIVEPVRFFGVEFSVSTNEVDPQTGTSVPAPSLNANGGSLSGDFRSVAASWNNQNFNQGAPKPDGSTPGSTSPPSGTHEASTGTFTLEWASQISGGPFDGFTGLWHLEGRFEPRGGSGPATGGGADGTAGDDTPDEGGVPEATPAGADPAGASTADGGATDSPTGADPEAPDATASDEGREVTVSTRSVSAGQAPPAWLVVLVTIVGVMALGAFLLLDRVLRRATASGVPDDGRPMGRLVHGLRQPSARIALALVAVACFLALAFLALTADEGNAEVTERAVTRSPGTPSATPAPPSEPAVAPQVAPSDVLGASVASATTSTTTPADAPPSTSSEVSPEPPDEPPPPDACALGIPPPERSGGLASLVPLVPAFGPFSAEAFAMTPAYEPVVGLFGPLLPMFATALEENQESVEPVIEGLRQLEVAGYEQLAPLYEPYRPEVLAALADLAETLAPYSEQLADSQAGVCLVALEGVVAAAADA